MSTEKRNTNPSAAPTSGNREESMRDSEKDAFGKKNAERNSNPASSGTTGLGGESRDADRIKSPGGVEGDAGNK